MLIARQDGYVDLIPDRSDITGPTREGRHDFLSYLTAVLPEAFDVLGALLAARKLSTGSYERVDLYRDAAVRIEGSPMGVNDRFYLTATATGS